MMNYSKFQNLLETGEQAHVDFKIRCEAFNDNRISSKGELAKDICAMSNNGNRVSYIIIGVSDDRENFLTVSNGKLTDDTIQDFCKTAIFPSTKIKLYRATWNRAIPKHMGKEFVVIQIGPNPRQVFRLNQDFIDYNNRKCFRRNEVWIRRGATSDLATPEEIVRMAKGELPFEDDLVKTDREAFSCMSIDEQKRLINVETANQFNGKSYTLLPESDWFGISFTGGGRRSFQTLWKLADSTVFMVCLMPCQVSLKTTELRDYPWYEIRLSRLVNWNNLPTSIKNLTRTNNIAVRRIYVVPVLRNVPQSRITTALPELRKVASIPLYYRPDLDRYRWQQIDTIVPSSNEILILDKITSLVEYREFLSKSVAILETDLDTVVQP